MTLLVNLKEAFQRLNEHETCPHCGGTGLLLRQVDPYLEMMIKNTQPCYACQGTKQVSAKDPQWVIANKAQREIDKNRTLLYKNQAIRDELVQEYLGYSEHSFQVINQKQLQQVTYIDTQIESIKNIIQYFSSCQKKAYYLMLKLHLYNRANMWDQFLHQHSYDSSIAQESVDQSLAYMLILDDKLELNYFTPLYDESVPSGFNEGIRACNELLLKIGERH